MKRVCRSGIWIVLIGLFWPNTSKAVIPGGKSLPSAQEVMQKALERTHWAETNETRSRYTFLVRQSTEQFDGAGHLKSRKEKLYQVHLTGGWTHLRLIQVNGQNLSAAELKRQEMRERHERQKITMGGSGHGGDRRENFLSPELVAKYHFRLVGEELVNGRPAYVLTFQPKFGELPVRQPPDRFLNQLAGRLWVDKEEFEVARAEIQLQGEVNLWAGILASLKRLAFTVVRTRIEDGIWFNQDFDAVLAGRRLVEPFNWRTQSSASHFQKLSTAQIAAANGELDRAAQP